MVGFDYGKSKATADRLIEKFGQAVSIRRTTVVGGVASDPTSGTSTDTDYVTKAAIIDYTSREIDGTAILATDQRALIAVGDLTIDLETSDKLVVGSVVWPIFNINKLSPAGTIVLWDAQLRA